MDIGSSLEVTGGNNWFPGTYTITAVEDLVFQGVTYSAAILDGQPNFWVIQRCRCLTENGDSITTISS